MAKTEEGKLEEQVNNYLKKRRVWKLARFQAQSNQNGVPDRLYLYKGILLGFELKTKTGKPTGLQIKKIAAINDNGGIGIIVTDVGEIERLLDIIDKYYKVMYAEDGRVRQIRNEYFYRESARYDFKWFDV